MHLPERQRDNFVADLHRSLLAAMTEEEVTQDRAFALTVLEAVGIDPSSGELSDGRSDHGIDFWLVGENETTIFQFKSFDFTREIVSSNMLTPGHLKDLPRIIQVLTHVPDAPDKASNSIKQFVQRLHAQLSRFSERRTDQTDTYKITIYLAGLAGGFSEQAQSEFARLTGSVPDRVSGTPVHIDTMPVLLDDILDRRWSATNTDWRDRAGTSRNTIDLRVVGGKYLSEPKSCLFFTKAYDLVRAYTDFGHQLFEPNVRCQIRRSKINEAIRASVQHDRSRREFKHLNNGITMICDSYSFVGPHDDPRSFRITKPGIINGLQTVVSIGDAYTELDATEKKSFDADCELLVRLHTRNAVHDYQELVKSTNNQNPMLPRNLHSNDPEQVALEKLFAALGWFYERKQDAWLAFKSDHKLWRNLPRKSPADFDSGGCGYRIMDNDDLGQCWLAFIGFSDEAVHDRKRIFGDEKVYELVFQSRPKKHGADFDFKLGEAVFKDAISSAPDPTLMLLAFLFREAARSFVPSPTENRNKGVSRLNLEGKSREDQDATLNRDGTYLLNKILRAWSLLFPEVVGFVLFRAFGEKVHQAGPAILQNHSLKELAIGRNFEAVHARLAAQEFDPDDFLLTMWCLFEYCAGWLVSTPWLQQWQSAPTRTRFNYSSQTRRPIVDQIGDFDAYLKKEQVLKPWASGMNKQHGVFKYAQHLFR